LFVKFHVWGVGLVRFVVGMIERGLIRGKGVFLGKRYKPKRGGFPPHA
jgi:hypothetical protein